MSSVATSAGSGAACSPDNAIQLAGAGVQRGQGIESQRQAMLVVTTRPQAELAP